MNKVLEYIIRAFDRTKEGTDSAGKGADSMASRIGRNLANIKAGWDMLAGGVRTAGGLIADAARGVWRAVSEAFKFETLTTQLSVLMGSMDKAKARMKELSDFAAAPPFQLDEVVRASRQLHVFSDGAMGAKESLKLVGDAAAAVGTNIEELSFWVGRAYSMIKGGQPFGEAAMRLQEMGAITPQVRQQMEELQKAGASNAEVWAVLETRLRSFKGGMETLSKTGDGLVSTLKDNWTAAVRKFGESFMALAKDEIGFLIARLQKLVSDGTIQKWATKALEAIQPLVEIMGNLFDDKSRSESMGASWDYLKAVFSYGFDLMKAAADYLGAKLKASVVGALPSMLGGDPEKARVMGQQANTQFRWDTHVAGVEFSDRKDDAAKRIREAAERRREREQDAIPTGPADDGKQAAADEAKKLADDLAAAQAANDARLLREQEGDRIEAAKKESEEREKASARLIAEEHEARMRNVRRESDESAKLAVDARDRLSRARAGAQQAWGWYRDPESFKRQLAEEKDEAAAQKQFDKDFDKLNDRRDWRTTDRLSEREESVRRVALSREEEKRAEAALVAIEANTKDLAKKLDELLSMKGGA